MTSAAGKVWQPTKDHRVKKRGEWYWARFQKRGIEICESLGTKSFATAVLMVESIEQDILMGVDRQKEVELFDTAWPDFLMDKANGVKTTIARKKTLVEYTGFGDRYFVPHFNHLRLSELNEETWENFVLEVRKTKPDMQFFNVRKYLMGFLSWAKRKGKIREKPELFDPDAKLKAAREEQGPGKAYTIEELRSMRAAAAKIGGSFFLFVLLCQFMGMRPFEVTQLKLDRIDLERWVILLRKADTKTKKPRTVPIHPEVRQLLAAQVAAMRPTSPYLFPNRNDINRPMSGSGFRKSWDKVKFETGVDGRAYDYRHSLITHAVAAGINPSAVAVWTGTSLKMIQEIYLHLSPEQLVAEIGRVHL